MIMTDDQRNSNQLTTWSGRYHVRAEIRYHSRRKGAGVMQVILYQPALTEEDCSAFLAEVGFTPEAAEWTSLVSQAKDTFSDAKSAALVRYLNAREGTTAQRSEARLPAPGVIGASAIPTLPSFRDGFVYRLYTERGYNLPFKAEAINVKTYLNMARLFNEMRNILY
jgi:predicted TIM-barrel fold metal-dependent hydrolase